MAAHFHRVSGCFWVFPVCWAVEKMTSANKGLEASRSPPVRRRSGFGLPILLPRWKSAQHFSYVFICFLFISGWILQLFPASLQDLNRFRLGLANLSNPTAEGSLDAHWRDVANSFAELCFAAMCGAVIPFMLQNGLKVACTLGMAVSRPGVEDERSHVALILRDFARFQGLTPYLEQNHVRQSCLTKLFSVSWDQ